jgi:hypothetical protein
MVISVLLLKKLLKAHGVDLKEVEGLNPFKGMGFCETCLANETCEDKTKKTSILGFPPCVGEDCGRPNGK